MLTTDTLGITMRYFAFLFLILPITLHADTIDHYMNIANNIPQMEIKADPQAQAWARSARTVLILTSESIIDTLTLFNDAQRQNGSPLFCPPAEIPITATMLNELIQQTYKELSSQQSDKDKMTVSQVALLGLKKQYPCTPSSGMQKQETLTQQRVEGIWPKVNS